jgi:hypothetical protein
MSKHGETLTRTSKWPRPDGGTPTERIIPLENARYSKGPVTYKEALTKIKISILKESYPDRE